MKKKTGIAELKANLSAYIKAANGGQTITITDHATPVALLAPYSKNASRSVRIDRELESDVRKRSLKHYTSPLKGKVASLNVLSLLREDRDKR